LAKRDDSEEDDFEREDELDEADADPEEKMSLPNTDFATNLGHKKIFDAES